MSEVGGREGTEDGGPGDDWMIWMDGWQGLRTKRQRSEVRGQRTEDWKGQRTEVGRQMSEVGCQMSEGQEQGTEDRGREGTDVGSQPSTQSYAVPRRSESPRLNTSCTIYRSYRAGLKGPVQLGKEVRGQRSGMIAPVKYASLSFGI